MYIVITLLLYPVQSVLCLTKGILVLSVVIAVHGFLNVCVVIAGYHNHIIKGWSKFTNMLGGNY